LKISLILADRSGLRKKETVPPDPSIIRKDKLRGKKLTSFLAKLGIGSEVKEKRAERIRTEIKDKSHE